MLEQHTWLNEPAQWQEEAGVLSVVTDAHSDFWQRTHYGFQRDSGHFYGAGVAGDFTAQVHVQGEFKSLYDQAGLMVRVDEQNWIKVGVEVSDGELMLGSVLTVGQSDWATGVFKDQGAGVWLRVTLVAGVMRVQASTDGLRWPLLRLAVFPVSPGYSVGPFCCSPERGGLNVRFSDFSIVPPLGKGLHDLS